MRRLVPLGLAVLLAPAGVLRAQEPPGAPLGEGLAGELGEDPTFGPLIAIERIEVAGNRSTAARLILRALPLREGDVVRAGDRRLREARFKVLALGFFRDVTLTLERGSRRGLVVLRVEVTERGTVAINRLYFGTTLATPWWLGADVSDRNFVGSGLGVGAALVYAAQAEIDGAEPQWAGQLRLDDPSLAGSAVGVHGRILHAAASEPYRVMGASSDGSPANFRSFTYRRTGARVGVGFRISPLIQLVLDGRLEHVDADAPAAPTRLLEDGTSTRVDLALRRGASRVATAAVGFDRDTRPDPVLPIRGDRLVVLGELGATWLGGDYSFATALARYERWFPVSGVSHVLSIHLTGGLVLGDAPLFDRIYVGDLNKLLSPRALGLVVSTLPSHDLLDTSADQVTYGEVAGAFELEYSYRLFRDRFHVYGGDLFAGAGVFGLTTTRALAARDASLYRALPVDLFFDVRLRLDTAVGIFELTFANALGRIPL